MAKVEIRAIALCTALVACVVACSQRSEVGSSALPPYARDAANAPLGEGVKISGTGSESALDKLVVAFMVRNHVANAELAASRAGKTFFSHAYTQTSIAKSTTTTATIIRLASLTKAWTSAALYNLILEHKLKTQWKAFEYLGITKPLPLGAPVDPRVYKITIEDLIEHKSGWDDQKSHWDPTFRMRQIALRLGLTHRIDQTQEVRFQLHEPLQEDPGTYYAYCNICYTILGMIVAKASGVSYPDYISHVLGRELGVNNVLISPTIGKRLPNEVGWYYNPYRGRSAYYITSKQKYLWAYSGDSSLNEVAAGAGGMATNAESMLVLMNHYIIWGVGTPPPAGYSAMREGEMPGANTFAAQLQNGVNYSFLVNTNAYAYGTDPEAFIYLQDQLIELLGYS